MPIINAALSLCLGIDFSLHICVLFFAFYRILAYFPNLKKKLKKAHAISMLSICLYIRESSLPLLTFECLNQSLLNLVYIYHVT
jgi:hypothetical protein